MDSPSPHVVILSFPSQGHIKPMLTLAELLCEAGFIISFVTTEHSHSRLDRAGRSPGIRFMSIPDGLRISHPRSGPTRSDLYYSISTTCKPIFKQLIQEQKPPACIISDGTMSFGIEVADELGIASFTFRTYNATNTWISFHLQNLIENGEIPLVEGNEEIMDRPITSIPGLENIMRGRDLPSICRLDTGNPLLQFYINQASKMTKASALILNTFEELESPMISHLKTIFPKVYAIGPLHSFSVSQTSSGSTSLMKIDRSCMDWLDSQEPKSVLYVSFGSIVQLSHDEFLEFWYGLVNSGKKFLWAVRPGMILGGVNLKDLKKETEERGRIVGWAPQVEVLAHFAVGGFFTHCGWNSTLESICCGVPMICWPRMTDQQVNSRCIGEIWKIGLDMKDKCDRLVVEKMVRDLMEGRREEIVGSMVEMGKLARESTSDGGLSNRNIKKLIEDIKLLHSTNYGINSTN